MLPQITATNRLGKLLMSHTAFSCTTHLNDKTKIFSIEIEVSSKKFLTEKCFSINQMKTSGIILVFPKIGVPPNHPF